MSALWQCLRYPGATASVKEHAVVSEGATIDVEEAMRSCGRLSLYVWLRLSDYDVTYKEVSENVPVTSRGTSLSELARALTHWCSGLTVVKAQPADLDRLSFPAIAHVWLSGEEADEGHYLVLLNVKPDTVVYADPALGGIRKMPRTAFYKDWSGYVLVRNDPIGIWAGRLSGLGLTLIALVSLVFVLCGCNKRSSIGLADAKGRECRRQRHPSY